MSEANKPKAVHAVLLGMVIVLVITGIVWLGISLSS